MNTRVTRPPVPVQHCPTPHPRAAPAASTPAFICMSLYTQGSVLLSSFCQHHYFLFIHAARHQHLVHLHCWVAFQVMTQSPRVLINTWVVSSCGICHESYPEDSRTISEQYMLSFFLGWLDHREVSVQEPFILHQTTPVHEGARSSPCQHVGTL
jgi:hypothetical protein